MRWWKIYYCNGTTFSSEEGAPFDAPRTGVQVIAYDDEGGVSLLSQADYYYYEPECTDWGWWHCSMVGMVLHLQRAKRPLILFGEMTLTDNFTEIEKIALKEAGERKRRWRRRMDTGEFGQVTHG